MKKKINVVALVFTIAFVLWTVIIYTDFKLCQSNQKPIFTYLSKHYDYNDGYVDLYSGLGYKYYEYHRTSINGQNFIPFWMKDQGLLHNDII
jgi:hypothetical protein